jgi:hypothetical protein
VAAAGDGALTTSSSSAANGKREIRQEVIFAELWQFWKAALIGNWDGTALHYEKWRRERRGGESVYITAPMAKREELVGKVTFSTGVWEGNEHMDLVLPMRKWNSMGEQDGGLFSGSGCVQANNYNASMIMFQEQILHIMTTWQQDFGSAS